MICQEAEYWIFSSRRNTPLAPEVALHLQECNECRGREAELKQLDQQISKFVGTPCQNDLTSSILGFVQDAKQVAAPKNPIPTRHSSVVRIALYLTGAAALVLFGWFLGRTSDVAQVNNSKAPAGEEPTVVYREKIVPINLSADRNLIRLLLKRNAHLVRASKPSDRLDVLLDMADDCRQHALKLIEHGPRDSLPQVLELYTLLLHEGVLVQLSHATAEHQPVLHAAARDRLDKMAETTTAAKQLPQLIDDHRVVLHNTTRQTIDRAARLGTVSSTIPSPRKVLPESMSPAAALVFYAVTFSSESDPLAKADSCSDCVHQLMPHIMLYLAEDESHERTEMGEHFGEMINHGVYVPLEVATAKNKQKHVHERANRIFEKTSKTVTALEINWRRAAATAKVGLQRALEASKKNWEKNRGKVKGSWKRNTNQKPTKKDRSETDENPVTPANQQDVSYRDSYKLDNSQSDVVYSYAAKEQFACYAFTQLANPSLP